MCAESWIIVNNKPGGQQLVRNNQPNMKVCPEDIELVLITQDIVD